MARDSARIANNLEPPPKTKHQKTDRVQVDNFKSNDQRVVHSAEDSFYVRLLTKRSSKLDSSLGHRCDCKELWPHRPVRVSSCFGLPLRKYYPLLNVLHGHLSNPLGELQTLPIANAQLD